MSVAAVLFDAGGTLLTEKRSRPALYADVLRAHGADVDERALAAELAALHDAMPAVVDGAFAYTDRWFREFVARLMARLGLRGDPEALRREIAARFTDVSSFRLFPDVLPTLGALGERGLRLGVVSNWSDRLPALLDGLGLAGRFDAVLVSATAGHLKPDAALFEKALERLDVAPDRALHVGDHPRKDVAGARAAGLRALLLDRAGRAPPGRDVVRSLDEVPDRLDD